jgi:hypothetical protein
MNKGGYWGVFVRGAVSGAAFLNEFKLYRQFDKFVTGFSDDTLAAVPICIAEEVYGMGFALACDFLKECGYRSYAKPDTHIKTILSECCLMDQDDYGCFQTIVQMARANDEWPVVVDQVLWRHGAEGLRDRFIKGVRRRL